jgi:hypothetical protein
MKIQTIMSVSIVELGAISMYNAKVLADSVVNKPDGSRLLTVEATFPRFILAELNTHRVFSRNSASSRAIPTEKMIERVKENPFVPETFNKRVKGMGIGEELSHTDQAQCKEHWLEACENAVQTAEILNEVGIDKSRANRLLEPFMWHTAIISSTEWDNFFALRCPEGDEPDPDFPAQIEFQKIALLMRKAMRESEPKYLNAGEWHLPLVNENEFLEDDYSKTNDMTYWAMVSAGRCARVSYDTHENFEPVKKSYERGITLRDSGHMSPFEHQATPATNSLTWSRTLEVNYGMNDLSGNFSSDWAQFRKMIPVEWNRIGYLEKRDPWDASVSTEELTELTKE